MKKLLTFFPALLLVFFSCEKSPTIADAEKESYDHLIKDGFTDLKFVNDVEPTCDPVFQYRFSFTGKQEGDQIKGCICWTKPTRIFIHINERENQK